MKALFLLSAAFMAVVIFGFSSQSVAVTAAQWNAMNQSQKDLTIFSVALASEGNYSPDCKDGAKTIVSTASGGVVNLPATKAHPNDYQWFDDPHVTNRQITDITNVGTMDILQMYWYPTVASGHLRVWEPHTAIVVSRDATTMTWIDGNYVSPGNIIGQHVVTFTNFNSYLAANPAYPAGGNFTVYHVH